MSYIMNLRSHTIQISPHSSDLLLGNYFCLNLHFAQNARPQNWQYFASFVLLYCSPQQLQFGDYDPEIFEIGLLILKMVSSNL